MQISIVNGCVEYDGEPILNEINFVLNNKEKVAIVGRNGSGKTTLLKAILGEVEMIKGTGSQDFSYTKSGVDNIATLKQTFDSLDRSTLFEVLLEAYAPLVELEKKIAMYTSLLETDHSDKTVKTYATLNDEYSRMGGYTYQKELKTGVKAFGFCESDLSKPMCEFSGGQRTKIALLKLLLSKPQVLLLDEPTNHLDLEAIEWLEKYLSSYKNAFILVSHDRMFIDKTCNVVYEIEYGEMKRYSGNYTAFTIQKQQDYDKALKDAVLKQKEIARLQALVDRFRYKANKAKMAQAKLKQIERLGPANIPFSFDTTAFRASFTPHMQSVEQALTLNHLQFGYDHALGEIDTVIKRGDKLGIIGANGTGKSTLIKTIMGVIPALNGSVRKGLHLDIGYFDQTMTQNYSSKTLLEDFHDDFPMLSDEECRRALGSFLFTKEDVFKIVGDLSGGEKVRLALCKIFKKRPNMLILDEPTNHLDIIGKNALENMLCDYEGTLITVSHDRYFINRVCNRIAVFDNNTLALYPCSYNEYLANKQSGDTVINTLAREIVKKQKPQSSDNERRKKQHRIEVLEEKMAVLENEKASLSSELENNPAVFSDYVKVNEINEQIAIIDKKIAPFFEEWSILLEEIENM